MTFRINRDIPVGTVAVSFGRSNPHVSPRRRFALVVSMFIPPLQALLSRAFLGLIGSDVSVGSDLGQTRLRKPQTALDEARQVKGCGAVAGSPQPVHRIDHSVHRRPCRNLQ